MGNQGRRALLVVNRRSREGEADLAAGVALLQQSGFVLDEHYSADPARIPAIIRERGKDAELVIVGGGDGTLNTAVAAVAENGLPLGILPMGTANDLARTLKIPMDLVEACRVIGWGRVHRIDLGWVNGHLFFNVASIGLGVRVTQQLSPEIKHRYGVLAYPRALLQTLRENRSFPVEIVCDGQVRQHRTIQVAVGNGRHYGGGMTIAEEATLDDHLLHLYSLEPQPLWPMLRLAPALRRGRYPDKKEILLMKGREIEVRTHASLAVDTDGELTTATPATFRVLESYLPVFIPPEAPVSSGENKHVAQSG